MELVKERKILNELRIQMNEIIKICESANLLDIYDNVKYDEIISNLMTVMDNVLDSKTILKLAAEIPKTDHRHPGGMNKFEEEYKMPFSLIFREKNIDIKNYTLASNLGTLKRYDIDDFVTNMNYSYNNLINYIFRYGNSSKDEIHFSVSGISTLHYPSKASLSSFTNRRLKSKAMKDWFYEESFNIGKVTSIVSYSYS